MHPVRIGYGTKGGSRGQSQAIGAVLIFGFIIAALGAAQVVLVPQANEEVEFNHNDRAQQDMQEVRSAIQRSAAVGSSQSESVELAANYPTRFLLLNPSEGAGTIRTADRGSIVIENAAATDDEVADFWDGSDVSATNKRLIYTPNYNYYESAPETVYENSVLYNSFPDETNITKSGQNLVNGRQIYLTALTGNKSTSQEGVASVDVQAVSPATETINVQADSGPVNVTVPTQLSEEVWVQELLADEIDDSGNGAAGLEATDEECADIDPGMNPSANGRFIVGCDYDDTTSPNELTLTFQETSNGDLVTYSLKMAKLGVGTGFETPNPQYITDTKGDGADVALNGRQEVVFQVRDKYNNPAEDVEVDVQVLGGTSGQKLLDDGNNNIIGQPDDNIPVGPDGSIRLTYVAPGSTMSSPIDVNIQAEFDTGGSQKSAEVSTQIINASRIDRTQPLINPSDTVTIEDSKIVSPGPGNSGDDQVNISFASDSDRTITGIRYSFYNSDGQGNAPTETHPTMEIVDSDGNAIQSLDIGENFESVNIDIPNSEDSANDEGRVRVRFKKGGSTADVGPGDYFVVSIIIN